MSFLTPLYLLGAAAIALPILFHMIRRTPRGRQLFSSVMFLEPSPPRITRRSRIENWLLLLLRAGAVCLLALAFARPFFRQQQNRMVDDPDSRQLVVLVDTSASMRREGLWDEAVTNVLLEIDDAAPIDEVCIVGFDNQPRTLVSFDQWTGLEPQQRRETVRDTLDDVSPSWQATNLGRALVQAADLLEEAEARHVMPRAREIVLISDLQDGSQLDALQTYHWPADVDLRLATIGRDLLPSNAGMHPLREHADQTQARVRVTNARQSTADQFQIRWADDGSPSSTDADSVVTVTVAPGESRVVTAPAASAETASNRLVLTGDDQPFDNTCFVETPPVRTTVVGVLSADASDDPQRMRYYIEPALPSTPGRNVQIVDWTFESDPPTDPAPPNLIIVTETLLPAHVASLRTYIKAGGVVLLVPLDADASLALYELLDVAPVPAIEAEVTSYSMLTDIDFSHPMFAALADPRFSDFTKLHIWKHRTIDEQSLPEHQVLARFDHKDVAIAQFPLGTGSIVLLTSGWHPDDSQLALSTKFIPMMNGLLESAAGLLESAGSYHVGDSIALGDLVAPGESVQAIQRPDGERVTMADHQEFAETDEPGIYRVIVAEPGSASSTRAFAVNLAPAESRTDPFAPDALESAGVRLASTAALPVLSEAAERQLRARELEGRQKVWRWLVLLAIGVLLLETWLAGRLARKSAA